MTSFPDARISKTVVNSDIVVDLNNPSTSLTITEKFPDPLYDLLSPDDRRTLDEGVGIGFKSKSGTWLKKDKDGELSHSTEVYIFSWYDISKETISTEKQEKETIVGKPHSNSLGTVLKKRFCNRNQYNALSPNLQDMLLPPGVDLLDAQFVSLVANGTTFDKLEIHFNYKGPLSSNQYCLVSGKAGKIDWIPWPRVANHTIYGWYISLIFALRGISLTKK